MLVFYVDEWGDGSLATSAVSGNPWFILGALGIKDTSRPSAADHLKAIKDSTFGPGWQNAPWAKTEIKGRYVTYATTCLTAGTQMDRHRVPEGYWSLTLAQINDLAESLIRTFRIFGPVLYAIGVDKKRHIARGSAAFNPISVAYAYLQQRISLLVQRVYGSSEGALMLADQQQHHESLFRHGEVRQVRLRLQRATLFIPKTELIITKPVWVDETEMTIDRELTQLTDFMLYAVGQGMARANWTFPHLERLAPHFARHWGLGTLKGAVWNAGITIYPPTFYPRVTWGRA